MAVIKYVAQNTSPCKIFLYNERYSRVSRKKRRIKEKKKYELLVIKLQSKILIFVKKKQKNIKMSALAFSGA